MRRVQALAALVAALLSGAAQGQQRVQPSKVESHHPRVCSHTTCYLRCKGGRTLDQCNGVPDSVCRDTTDCHTIVQDWFGSERHGTRHRCTSNMDIGGCTCLCSSAWTHSALVHDASHQVVDNGKVTMGHERKITGITTGHMTMDDNTVEVHQFEDGSWAQNHGERFTSDAEPSCSAWYDRGVWESGLRKLFVNGKTFTTMCEQDMEGGGWTLLAAVTSGGNAWKYGDDSSASAWENHHVVFGNPGSGDYKNHAFNYMPKSQIMITINGRHLLTTDDQCVEGETLLSSLRMLSWDDRDGGDSRKPSVFHYCRILSASEGAGDEADEALGRGQDFSLYFKWGQAQADADDQLTRVFLSTSSRRPVRAPVGLGVYRKDGPSQVSMNVGINEFEPEAEDAGLTYRIWARLT